MDFFKTLLQPDVLRVLGLIGLSIIVIGGLCAMFQNDDNDDIDNILNY